MQGSPVEKEEERGEGRAAGPFPPSSSSLLKGEGGPPSNPVGERGPRRPNSGTFRPRGRGRRGGSPSPHPPRRRGDGGALRWDAPPVKKVKKAGPASKTGREPAIQPVSRDVDQEESMETEQ